MFNSTAFRKNLVLLPLVLIIVLVFLVLGGYQITKGNEKDEKSELFEQKDEKTELLEQKDENTELLEQKDEKTELFEEKNETPKKENEGLFGNFFRKKKDNMMESFREKDSILVKEVLKMDPKSFSQTDAMHKFYWLLSFPVQGVCRVLKRIGGQWMVRQVDGDKFVCMDNMMSDKPCLIYSFGISNDWTFEDFMDFRGCEIHAHDPTVDFPAKRGKNIKFSKLGLSTETSSDMDTLANILKKNGHSDSVIEYLKIDVEGAELTGLPDWLKTGALDNVNQLAMELHLTGLHNGEDSNFIWLLEILQELYKLNFRVISHEVNMVMGPQVDGLYNMVEVVFMKDDVWSR
eukprot:GFUD01056427.1.p1 GENE.GFUD01056427.1~~GFUD01056427.1.p1  ORF type:complete len:347 (+),score=85.51 GFUD01056427.1:57-1097(+)